MDKVANIKKLLISRLARGGEKGTKTQIIGRQVMPDKRKQELLRRVVSPKEKARIMGMEGGKTKHIRHDSMSPKTMADRRAALEAKASPRDVALGRGGGKTKSLQVNDAVASRMAKDRKVMSDHVALRKRRADVAKTVPQGPGGIDINKVRAARAKKNVSAAIPPPPPGKAPLPSKSPAKTTVKVDNTPASGKTIVAPGATTKSKVIPISKHPKFKKLQKPPTAAAAEAKARARVTPPPQKAAPAAKKEAPKFTPAGTKVENPAAFVEKARAQAAAAKAKGGKGVTSVDKKPHFTPAGTKVDTAKGTKVMQGTQVDRQAMQGPASPGRKALEQAGKDRDKKKKVVQMAKWLAPAAVGGGAAAVGGYGAS